MARAVIGQVGAVGGGRVAVVQFLSLRLLNLGAMIFEGLAESMDAATRLKAMKAWDAGERLARDPLLAAQRHFPRLLGLRFVNAP